MLRPLTKKLQPLKVARSERILDDLTVSESPGRTGSQHPVKPDLGRFLKIGKFLFIFFLHHYFELSKFLEILANIHIFQCTKLRKSDLTTLNFEKT